jgi:hypothetical protein
MAEQLPSTRSAGSDYTTPRKPEPVRGHTSLHSSVTFDTQLDECYTYPTKQEEKKIMAHRLNESPIPYWTNPDHRYRVGELLICAMQYACPEEDIGFRYENPILITEDGCEVLSKFRLGIEEI